jgi:cytoskeletal protein CcmA (bactofilin family)
MGDFYNRGGGSQVLTDLEVDGTTVVVDESNDRVGIGTATPGVQLEVQDTTTSSANTGGALRLSANDGAAMGDSHRLGVIEFTGAEDTSNTQVVGARIEAMTDAAWTNAENGTALYFYTTDGNASQTNVLKIDSNQKATFSGNVQVAGDIILDDGGSLKEAGGTAAITFDGSGHVTKIGQDTHTSGQFLKWDGSKAVWDAVATGSSAADDISTGDAAVNIATTAGNITIDAQGNNTDIIFKGTDDGSDTTFLTIDGSAAGAATFNNKIVATELDISGDVDVDGTLEADAITLDGTALGSLYSPIAGSSSITTVGTVGTGTWQGTAIAQAYIANDAINGDKIADDAINSEHYVDGSIDTAHIADDQVTLDKMAGIARGKIIYGDASGNPAVLAPGSNNQVLTSDGTDISWQNAAAGGANADDSNTILHMQVFGR